LGFLAAEDIDTKRAVMKNFNRSVIVAAAIALAAVLGGPHGELHADVPLTWSVNTWPDGRIPYRFATAADDAWDGTAAVVMSASTKDLVRAQMAIWEASVSSLDPADRTRRYYIDFYDCGANCPKSHVVFRMNSASENNNMCTYYTDYEDANNDGDREEHVGRNPDDVMGFPVTQFHMEANDGGGVMVPGTTRSTTDANTLRHELGHCLGLWHEQNRSDRDAWLDETPDADTPTDWENQFDVPLRFSNLMPLLGNYDYDSIMHYKSRGTVGGTRNELRWTDAAGNEFSRSRLSGVSRRDVSRVMQYYARQAYPQWGFFQSLGEYSADSDTRPDPLLADGVSAVGTPAVAWQSEGNYDVFARGSDDRIYWKSIRRRFVNGVAVNSRAPWTSLGCCFASDPSAVAPAFGHVEVAAIGAVTGRPSKKRLLDDAWGGWTYVAGETPSEIASLQVGSRIGPAIASRPGGVLDVFVVLNTGNLAVSTRVNGVWTNWTEFEKNVNITARPAALAVSGSEVRLAVTADDVKLYEPLVTFNADSRSPTATFGVQQATTQYRSAPAIAARADARQPYRVLIVGSEGRVAHKFQGGAWRDIGGIPLVRTGITAVGDGALGALIVMQGEHVFACALTCVANQPNPGGFIQTGGVWMRRFY
jgi:hypothetical protein